MKTIKLESIEDAVRSGPFRRFSRFRATLLVELFGAAGKYEASDHTDNDLIQDLADKNIDLANLQGFLDLQLNPALQNITYQEFIIGTPDDTSRAELKAVMEPYYVRPGVMVKGTFIEPIEFKGKTPVKYRVVAYDDLIKTLKAKYATITVAVG